jgi:DUF971 family protein
MAARRRDTWGVVANQAGQPARDEPVDIRYDNARQRLEISWADGHESAYDYELLRWRCPCAECAGEMGQPGRLRSVRQLRPEQYALRAIELVGHYAVRPTWSDGHDTGIYAFDRLRDLDAEAAEDLRRKAAGQDRALGPGPDPRASAVTGGAGGTGETAPTAGTPPSAGTPPTGGR